MAITFVGSNTGTASFGSVNLALPAMNQNDLVLLFVGCVDTTAAGPPSTSGYTPVANLIASSLNRRLYVAYKFMGATPDGTVIIPITVPALTTAMALVFRGANTTTPLDVAFTSIDNASVGIAPNAPAITPTNNDCCVVIAAFSARNLSVGSVANYLPSPSVAIATENSPGNHTIASAYRILSGGAATAEDPLAWSTWGAGPHLAITIALRALTASVNFVTVDQATVTATGKTVTVLETTAVSKASVAYSGKVINIPDAKVEGIFVDKATVALSGKAVNPFDIQRAVIVDKAAVLYRGRTVTPREIFFEDIPRYSVRGRGSGHWMETR